MFRTYPKVYRSLHGKCLPSRRTVGHKVSPRLASLTSRYQAHLVFSEAFHKYLSFEAQGCCRAIDYISLQSEPFALFTFDMVTEGIRGKVVAAKLKGKEFEDSYEDDDPRISLLGGSPIIDHKLHLEREVNFEVDMAVQALQWDLHGYFLPLSRRAAKLYKSGKWQEAKELFDHVFLLKPDEVDGASGDVYKFMELTQFDAGADWKGYRELG